MGRTTRSKVKNDPEQRYKQYLNFAVSDIEKMVKDLVDKSKSHGMGWEKKVLDPSKKTGEDHLNETMHNVKGRTTTRYGYKNGGLQGPHTIARCLGESIRNEKVKSLFQEYLAKKDQLGEDERLIYNVAQLYQPYVAQPPFDLQKHIVMEWGGGNSSPGKVSSSYDIKGSQTSAKEAVGQSETNKTTYQSMVKALGPCPGGDALKKWIAEHGGETYNPGKHYLEALEFYRSSFIEAQYNHSLSMENRLRYVVMFGQILSDLHPFATSFRDRASKAELDGGGEGKNRDKVMEIASSETPSEDDLVTYLTGKDNDGNKVNKGLIDESAVESIPDNLITAYSKYQYDVLVSLLTAGGLESEAAERVAAKVSNYEKPPEDHSRKRKKGGFTPEEEVLAGRPIKKKK